MVAFLRGWNEDFNDSDGDYIFGESLVQFRLTIPDSYTPGDAFTMTFTGGLASEGAFPTDVECGIRADVFMNLDGTPLDAGPFSDSGLTYAIGNTILSFVTGTSGTEWTAEGPGPTITTNAMGEGNLGGTILIDGTPFAPNEGCGPHSPNPVPIGWFPDAPTGGSDVPPDTVNLEPGNVCTIAVTTVSTSNDSDNPTRSFYPYLTGITVNIGSETVVVDLAGVKTGFNLGALTVPWDADPPQAPWNAFGTVATSQPAQAAGYQDMWFTGAATQRTQGYIF